MIPKLNEPDVTYEIWDEPVKESLPGPPLPTSAMPSSSADAALHRIEEYESDDYNGRRYFVVKVTSFRTRLEICRYCGSYARDEFDELAHEEGCEHIA